MFNCLGFISQARRERETKLAEEGWTVVVHRKGGKRTTDPDSGVAVGSVAEAAVRDKLAKKKSKDVGLDFYRFQRKEAHRSGMFSYYSCSLGQFVTSEVGCHRNPLYIRLPLKLNMLMAFISIITIF